MWIVVYVEYCYPSVFHFDNYESAKKFYDENQFGKVCHLAEVKEYTCHGEDKPKNIGEWNVVW